MANRLWEVIAVDREMDASRTPPNLLKITQLVITKLLERGRTIPSFDVTGSVATVATTRSNGTILNLPVSYSSFELSGSARGRCQVPSNFLMTIGRLGTTAVALTSPGPAPLGTKH